MKISALDLVEMEHFLKHLLDDTQTATREVVQHVSYNFEHNVKKCWSAIQIEINAAVINACSSEKFTCSKGIFGIGV